MDADTVEQVRALIDGKNFAALNDLLEPYGDTPACAALRRLSRLFGGVEVLDEAQAPGGGEPGAGLSAYPVSSPGGRPATAITSALTWGWSTGSTTTPAWSSGAMWRGRGTPSSPAAGTTPWWAPLGARRRPPALPSTWTRWPPACPVGTPPRLETLIHFAPDELARALETVDRMAGGTCELSPCEGLEDTLALAREKGARQVLVLENGGREEGCPVSQRLKIALTKGRLQDKSVELFEAMARYLRVPGRRLIHAIPNYPLDAVLAKAPDVITYVEHGVCDMGIAGKDTILEQGARAFTRCWTLASAGAALPWR